MISLSRDYPPPANSSSPTSQTPSSRRSRNSNSSCTSRHSCSPNFLTFLGLILLRMDAKGVLGNNDIDDVRWLCSLTESELDLLMGLKHLVMMRAKKVGHEELAMKFDLHMLRTLGSIFMEHLKGQLKNAAMASKLDCNLLKQNISGSFERMTVEDLYPYICSDKRKRITDMFFQDMPPSQKKKTSS